jgi:DNA-binding NarL/FixJ family response regulator
VHTLERRVDEIAAEIVDTVRTEMRAFPDYSHEARAAEIFEEARAHVSGVIQEWMLKVAPRVERDPAHLLLIPASGWHGTRRCVRLSPRERDLVALVAQGMSNKEIARRLRISVATTKEYVSHVLEKSGLPNRAALAAAYEMTAAALRSSAHGRIMPSWAGR